MCMDVFVFVNSASKPYLVDRSVKFKLVLGDIFIERA